MLFDLRSRRRKTAVRIVYVMLALVMGGGLILVGVGTGNGNGGLLNAFTNNGSGNSSQTSALVNKQVKAALKATAANPQSASDWQTLMLDRLDQAQAGSNYSSTTGAYTSSGKADLTQGIDAWNRYLSVTKDKPNITAATLADRLYEGLGDYGGQSTVYQYLVALEPKSPGEYTCLAYTAYAASDSQLGDLAAAKAVALSPKLQKLTLKTDFSSAKKSAATAKQSVAENNC